MGLFGSSVESESQNYGSKLRSYQTDGSDWKGDSLDLTDSSSALQGGDFEQQVAASQAQMQAMQVVSHCRKKLRSETWLTVILRPECRSTS